MPYARVNLNVAIQNISRLISELKKKKIAKEIRIMIQFVKGEIEFNFPKYILINVFNFSTIRHSNHPGMHLIIFRIKMKWN